MGGFVLAQCEVVSEALLMFNWMPSRCIFGHHLWWWVNRPSHLRSAVSEAILYSTCITVLYSTVLPSFTPSGVSWMNKGEIIGFSCPSRFVLRKGFGLREEAVQLPPLPPRVPTFGGKI